jgi:hypothetical protein
MTNPDLDLRINFTDVETQKEFKPIPPSRQHVMITDHDVSETGEQSQNPGAPKLVLELTVQDGDYSGRRVWDTFVFGEKTLWKIKGLMAALGEDIERDGGWTVGEIFDAAPDWVGRELVVRLAIQAARKDKDTQQEYNARNQVKNYYPVSDEDSLLP